MGLVAMQKRVVFVICWLLVALAATVSAQGDGPITTRSAPPDPAQVRLVEVASGFERPLYVTHAGDGSDRLFVVEQAGRIWILQDGERLQTPFLDLSNVVTGVGQGYSEQGLLGLAFHPDYADNGRFFVNYTDRSGNTAIAEYRVSADNPDRANPGSGQILLTAEQPYPNHNGGQLAFGPDGNLYIGLGDGGSGGDPQGNAQNTWTLLGKILRIDVSGAAVPYLTPLDNPFGGSGLGASEVWAYGLRNPWRFSFDRTRGDIWIGDVGQGFAIAMHTLDRSRPTIPAYRNQPLNQRYNLEY
jgi:glucose/arabinose dehydrogenase